MAVCIEFSVKNTYIFVKKCHIRLTFRQFIIYTDYQQGRKIMIDIYDSESIVKVYRLLNKKCDAIDHFIENHAYYFGPCTYEYGSVDVYNNILDLMTRKNELINLKLIVDNALKSLAEKDKKILYLKMNYNLSLAEICGVLELKERTCFRHIERAYENLSDALNRSRYAEKLEKLLRKEEWIIDIREAVEAKHMAYRSVRP